MRGIFSSTKCRFYGNPRIIELREMHRGTHLESSGESFIARPCPRGILLKTMPYPTYWTKARLNQLKDLYHSGYSMREVGIRMGKSTWAIRSVMVRHQIGRRPAATTRTQQFNQSPRSFHPKLTFTQSEHELIIAALMLYWGEGAKKNQNGQVNFANADPVMIQVFLRMLREIYQIRESKLRCQLYCFSSQDIQAEVAYWSNLTHIPPTQFTKPYITTNDTPCHAKIPHGVCHIVYSDKRLFETILSDIELLQHKLIQS